MTQLSSNTVRRPSGLARLVQAALFLSGALGLYACVAPVESTDARSETPGNEEVSGEDVGEARQALGECAPFTGPFCRAGVTCCSNTCVSLQTDEYNCGSCGNACGAHQTCTSGVCGCSAGYTMCGGVCVSLSTDEQNCGACGATCGSHETCSGGDCGCSAGYTLCSAGCVNLQTDKWNCGSCNHACHASPPNQAFCEDGGCN